MGRSKNPMIPSDEKRSGFRWAYWTASGLVSIHVPFEASNTSPMARIACQTAVRCSCVAIFSAARWVAIDVPDS